jgi:hypothetical protein
MKKLNAMNNCPKSVVPAAARSASSRTGRNAMPASAGCSFFSSVASYVCANCAAEIPFGGVISSDVTQSASSPCGPLAHIFRMVSISTYAFGVVLYFSQYCSSRSVIRSISTGNGACQASMRAASDTPSMGEISAASAGLTGMVSAYCTRSDFVVN